MTDSARDREKPDARAPRPRTGGLIFLLFAAVAGLLGWTGFRVWSDANMDDAARRLKEGFNQLRSQDSNERSSGVATLQFAYKQDDIDEALDALSRTLTDKDSGVRIVAANSIATLISRIKAPRTDTVATPEQVHAWSERAYETLSKSMSDSNAAVRGAVIRGIGSVTWPRETSPRGEPPDVPEKAAAKRRGGGGGGGGRGPRPEPHRPPADLVKALQNGTATWSRETAKAYYGYSDTPPPPELVAALKDESSEVRMAAIRTLQSFPLGLDAALPSLFELLAGNALDERDACRATLRVAWPQDAAVPTLTEIAEKGQSDARSLAVMLLERIGSAAKPAAPALALAYAKWLDSQERDALGPLLARALGRIAPGSAAEQDAVKSLVRALGSDDGPTRVRAAESLGKFGKAATLAVPKLRDLSKDEHATAAVRRAASSAVDAIEAKETAKLSPGASASG
jgi:HEAT repeat protein